jgi:hypothetical protein
MPNWPVVLIILLVIGIGIAAGRLAAAWWRYRGRMIVDCPENHQPAGVSLDVKHAALTALRGDVKLRLTQCSRWPEKAGCEQDCLSQIECAPEDCLVRNVLVHWYQDKNCAWCGRPIGEIYLAGRKPALLLADRSSVEWSEVPAERLEQTLAVAQPICFGCHIANTMVRQHSEKVIDRSRHVFVETPAAKK